MSEIMKKTTKKIISFPQSFTINIHPVVPGATQWLFRKGEKTISIVGGGMGLYGDGVESFEMYDFDEDGPRGYQTVEEINEYLESLGAM